MISYDARIEKAVYILWVDMEFDRGQEAKQLLEEALASGMADAYYYGDVIELMNVDMSQFTDEQATAQIRAWTETAAAMYDELIAKGMVMGAYNYIDIITSGDFGIPVNKKLAKKLEKIYDRKMNGSGIKGFMHKIFG